MAHPVEERLGYKKTALDRFLLFISLSASGGLPGPRAKLINLEKNASYIKRKDDDAPVSRNAFAVQGFEYRLVY